MRAVRADRAAVAIVVGAIGLALLVGCAAQAAPGLGSARDAYDAIGRLGVHCPEPLIGDSAGLPYTSISCGGLRIDWLDDADGYADLVRQDCAAAALGGAPVVDVPLVVGDGWVLRGQDPTQPGSWPRAVSPQQAAERLGGTVTDSAAYCAAARSD